jgi:hypothetical protein
LEPKPGSKSLKMSVTPVVISSKDGLTRLEIDAVERLYRGDCDLKMT